MSRLSVAATALLSPFLSAQDFLHFKFDGGCTAEVINYARGPGAFPENGVLESNAATVFAPGRFGQALAGGNAATNVYNRVRVGWVPSAQPMTGDITLAFFAKQRVAPGTSTNYLCGTSTTGHRLLTNGIAGTGLVVRDVVASGGAPTSVDLQLPGTTADFQSLAAAGWVHIAVVVAAAAGTADWYVNGLPVLQRTGVGAGRIDSTGEYLVGYQSTVNACNYDLDEFLLSNRAFSPAEIAQLAQAPRPGDGRYDSDVPSQCGAGNIVVGSAGGPPALGNSSYAITVSTGAPSFFVLLPGFTRCTFGGSIPLPLNGTPLLPQLSGCWIVADAVTFVGGTTAGSPVALPLPLPAAVANLGTTLFFQCLGLDQATLATSMSNGFAVGIGQ